VRRIHGGNSESLDSQGVAHAQD